MSWKLRVQPKKRGLLIVISGPSGAGKTTLCQCIINNQQSIRYSISVTTRPMRAGEKDGIDYFFVNCDKFKQMIANDELAEWACVHGYHYGTPKKFIETTLSAGYDIIMDLDVQGGMQLKKFYPDDIFVFVMPSSASVLYDRLKQRGTDDEKVIEIRLYNAQKEIEYLSKYTYLVINDKIEEAISQLKIIIQAERYHSNRYELLL